MGEQQKLFDIMDSLSYDVEVPCNHHTAQIDQQSNRILHLLGQGHNRKKTACCVLMAHLKYNLVDSDVKSSSVLIITAMFLFLSCHNTIWAYYYCCGGK